MEITFGKISGRFFFYELRFYCYTTTPDGGLVKGMTVPDGDNLVVSVFHSVSASKIWNVRGVAFDGNDLI